MTVAAMPTPRGAPGGTREKSIGHYKLGKTIGEGTFGKVKLGTHILTGEKVAVKILEKERIADVADLERVAREIKILKLVQHPHVIQLYEIIETPRQLYLIMEFCSGGELFDHIVQCGRVPEPDACRFFHQILGGLEQIHRSGVVHRDLKPENLLLDREQNIKIVDFGLSNTFQEGQLLKTACGSPCYAAPEMIAGHRYVPSRCDVWSSGVILFALVCGYLPFEDPNTAVLYNKILSAEYTPPKFISDGARDLIARMLTTEPDFRITIPRIRQHSWYRQIPEASSPYVPVEKGDEVLNQDVLDQMDRLEFPRSYTVKCLQMRKHNHATATYYLLLEKRSRTGGCALKQGEFPSLEAPMPAADADRAAGGAPQVPQFDVIGNEQGAGPFGLPLSARERQGEAEQRRSQSPAPRRSAMPSGPPAAPMTARPESQQRNYAQYYGGRGEPPATSRATAREPRSSAAAAAAYAARGAEREAAGSRAGAAPRRHSEAPRAQTPRGVAAERQPWGRRTPGPVAPVLATPRRSPPPSGQTPRTARAPSAPPGRAQGGRGPAAAYRGHTPGKAATPSPDEPLQSARRRGGTPALDRELALDSAAAWSPPASASAYAPARPAAPSSARGGPGVLEARRRHYHAAAPEVPPGQGRRSATPGSARGGGGPASPAAAAAAVASDLFGAGARSSTGGAGPASAWGAAQSQAAASPRAISQTPDQVYDRSSAAAPPGSAREAREESMRTCRGAFNVSCTSSKQPKQIVQEIHRALGTQQVAFKQASPFLVKCQKQGLRFEMEVAHLDHLESIYVVRFRRVAGELTAYRDLCSTILADMKI